MFFGKCIVSWKENSSFRFRCQPVLQPLYIIRSQLQGMPDIPVFEPTAAIDAVCIKCPAMGKGARAFN